MNTSYIKKIIAIVLILTCSFYFVPQKSEAFLGFGDIVSDLGVIPEEVAQTIGQVTQIENMVQGVLKEFGLDVVIYKLASQASQKLIAKVLNHTNGGADVGDNTESLFVKNFAQHFQNISDQEFSKYTEKLGNDTSNPFSKIIATSFVKDHADTQNPLSKFSLDKINGVDWQKASTDLGSAGKNGLEFFNQSSRPENTPVGSSLIAQSQLTSEIAKKVDVAKTELSSSGFKPDKGGCTSSPDSGFNFSNYSNFGQGGQDGGSSDKQQPCSTADVKSPSSTSETQTSQATNESFERLRNSDELGKILMNTISQLAQGLIKKGLSSLQSDGGASGKVYGGPQDLAKALNTPGSSWLNAPEQVVDLRADLEPAMEKTALEIKYIADAIDLVKAPVVGNVMVNGVSEPNIALRLEACIPGPDTGYDQRMQDYQLLQLKDTQLRSGHDNDKGSNNTEASVLIARLTNQALQEEKVILTNPFLNIPAANEMQGALREFYKLSSSFTGMIDTIILKRQTLNALQTLTAQVKSYGPGLILFSDQWNALSQTAKDQLYTSLGFSPIVDNPATPDVNEADPAIKDNTMKNLVFDNQWDKWETVAPEVKKTELYRQFIGLGRDISDSSTVENRKSKTASAEHQIQELGLVLHDCLKIRDYAAAGGASPVSQTLIDSLLSDRIKEVVAQNGPSIFNAAQTLGATQFAALNDRIIQSTDDLAGLTGNSSIDTEPYGALWKNMDAANKLQQNLPTTPAELIAQDNSQRLFCRLTMYHVIYWAPKPASAELTGKPIGCASKVWIPLGFQGSTALVESDRVYSIGSTGLMVPPFKFFEANWYHTNAAELLYKLND